VKALQGANLAVRFLLELSALAATASWGFETHWVLGVLAPAAVIVVWLLFLAPKRKIDVPKPIRLVLEFVVFGAAAVALAAAGQPELAIAFAVLAAISGTLNYLWD
jgi:Protein of unknown function (DUF2568)